MSTGNWNFKINTACYVTNELKCRCLHLIQLNCFKHADAYIKITRTATKLYDKHLFVETTRASHILKLFFNLETIAGVRTTTHRKFHRNWMNGVEAHTGQTKKHSFTYID